jgi:hypothetical protein
MKHAAFVSRIWSGFTLSLLLLISSCSQKAIDTQRDKNVDTQHYKTYRWVSQDDARYLSLQDPNTNQPVQAWVKIRTKSDTEERVRDVIERDLQQYGYRPQPEEIPDFFVTYYSPARSKEWLSSWTGITLAFQGAPLVIYPNLDMHKALEFRPGMAYVVIYDSKTKRPAWTGEVIDAISPQGEVNRPVVTARIQELIAKFKGAA